MRRVAFLPLSIFVLMGSECAPVGSAVPTAFDGTWVSRPVLDCASYPSQQIEVSPGGASVTVRTFSAGATIPVTTFTYDTDAFAIVGTLLIIRPLANIPEQQNFTAEYALGDDGVLREIVDDDVAEVSCLLEGHVYDRQ